MAEIAGLVFGVAGIAGQLYGTTMQFYDILSGIENFGADHGALMWSIELERIRLSSWERIWGISQGNSNQILDESDYRYRHVVGTLARIVVLFATLSSFEKYGVQAISPGASQRKRDRIVALFSPRPRKKKTSATTSSALPSSITLNLDPSSVAALQNPVALENRAHVPGLEEEINRIGEATEKLQQMIPSFKKLKWAVADKKKFQELVEQLKKYNDGLFVVLPESAPNPPPAPTPPPFPKFNVPVQLPVQRNKKFVGRVDFLDRLHNILNPPQNQGTKGRQVAVLYGLGGMGKTQIVTEYAYKNSPSYTSIFWIDATSQATLARSSLAMMEQLISHYQTKWQDATPDYTKIGDMLGLPGFIKSTGQIRDECPPELITRAIKKWLSSVGNNGWLVVFDNHDDIESVKMLDFFPTCDFGSIIVTTRRPEVKHLGVGMEVAEIDKKAGVSILLSSASKDPQIVGGTDYGEAVEIAEKLGYLPLALDQAGGYISAMGIPLSEYLPLYDTSFKQLASANHPGLLERYRSDTLFTTWKVSFDSLPPSARNLLYLCSFLANGNLDIPQELFDRAKGNISWLDKDTPFIRDGIKSLLSFSLTKKSNHHGEIGLHFHPLVLEWTRESLDTGGRHNFVMRAIGLLAGSLQFWSTELFKTVVDWVYERRVSPHIDISFSHIRRLPNFSELDPDPGSADAMAVIGIYLMKHSRYGEAEEMIQKSLEFHREISGNQDPNSYTLLGLRALRSLGFIFFQKKRYQEALEIYEQALPGLEQVSGEGSPDTLEVMGNMASVFSIQNHHQAALRMQERVLAGYERESGKEHPNTLIAMAGMGVILHRQGNHVESLSWYERALAGQERVLGKSHPNTLVTTKNIATVIQFQGPGRFHDALEMYRSVLATQEDLIGPKHPDTVDTVRAIAAVYQEDAKYQEALDLYQQVLIDQEQLFGVDNYTTCTTISNIAACLHSQGSYQEAIDSYKKALAVQEQILGNEHPETLHTVHRIASAFQAQGNGEEALVWYKRAISSREGVLGEEHPDTLRTIDDMALLIRQQGGNQEALELWEKIIAIQEQALGESHPDVLRIVSSMGAAIQGLGRCDEALELYKRALAGQEETLGPQHPETLRTTQSIAAVKYQQGETEEALRLFQQTLAMQEKVNGEEHADNFITIHNIASCFHIQGRYQEAVDLYRRVLVGRTKLFGPDSPWTISTAIELSVVEGKLQP